MTFGPALERPARGDAGKLPRLVTRPAAGKPIEIAPQVTRYDGSKRARLTADLPAGAGGTLEIVLPADADPGLALGRLELGWSPAP